MNCPTCGTPNDDNAAFCKACGARLKESAPVAPQTNIYAGFWKRFAAFLIDAIILAVVAAILRLAIAVPLGLSRGTRFGALVVFTLPVGIIVNWLYYSLMESSALQATVGKMALNIKVTDATGKRISFGRATGRYFGKIVSTIAIFIGYIMIGFTKKKQGLHDMMADTLVVNK